MQSICIFQIQPSRQASARKIKRSKKPSRCRRPVAEYPPFHGTHSPIVFRRLERRAPADHLQQSQQAKHGIKIVVTVKARLKTGTDRRRDVQRQDAGKALRQSLQRIPAIRPTGFAFGRCRPP